VLENNLRSGEIRRPVKAKASHTLQTHETGTRGILNMGLRGPLPEHILQRMSAKDRAMLGPGGLTAPEAITSAQKRWEREEQRIFARELNRLELPFCWHRTDKRSRATLGCPDFIVGCAGKTVWIEFKVEGGTLSDEQTKFSTCLSRQRLQLHICHGAAEAIKLIKNLAELCERSRPRRR
jgi:hypothetical protein